MRVLALFLFQVAVARGYFKLEARSFGKIDFEFPAFEFVWVKEGRKETEGRVEVGTLTITIGHSNNKQTKKLEVGMHKHSSNNNYYALKLQTYGNYVRLDSRTRSINKLAFETCENKTQKNSRDSEKSRSDKSRETHRLGKKQKRQIKKKPTDSEKSRSEKSRKTHRLGKKQKRQIKKETQTLKRGPTRAEIPNFLSIIRTFQDTETKTDRRSCYVFDNG